MNAEYTVRRVVNGAFRVTVGYVRMWVIGHLVVEEWCKYSCASFHRGMRLGMSGAFSLLLLVPSWRVQGGLCY